jgi:hypothetical protein
VKVACSDDCATEAPEACNVIKKLKSVTSLPVPAVVGTENKDKNAVDILEQ